MRISALCLAALLGTAPALLPAQGAADPVLQPPQGGLTDAGLKAMLEGLGLEPRPLSKGYLIAVKRDGWTLNVQLVLSKDLTKLGFNANLGAVPDPSSVPGSAWLKLLEDNEDIDPSSFYFGKEQKKLYLHRALDNRSVTPALLREQIDRFCGNIQSTKDDWTFVK